jgi:phage terminase large subunit GpA-like protein
MQDMQFLKTVIADAILPPEMIMLDEWSGKYRVLPAEASANPGRWDNERFPFLVEIMECLSPWHPCETVTFAKSAQVGGTEVGLNWMMYIADQFPGPTLMVHPTIQAGQAWVREKLSPSIRVTEKIRKIIVDQKSRDGASTTLFKSFANGYWVITGANSSVDISSKSIRYTVKEEWDRWPTDVDGQGDPDKLVDERQTSFTRSGLAKSYRASTPTIKGMSRIWRGFEEGDKRRYHVPCPHCGFKQVLRFFPDARGRGGLKFNATPPYQAKYACAECGVLIEHYYKDQMLKRKTAEHLEGAEWIAENADEGRQPSFHINALYSPVTTWDKMAEKFLDAKDDPRKLVAFVNLSLGEAWEERGDAPDWERLMERRSEYAMRTVPPGVVLITGASDVQKNGIYYEVVGWGIAKRSWSIDIGFIEGDPSDPSDEVWKKLDEVRKRKYPDAFGNLREIVCYGVDSGYLAGQVYSWSKRHPWTYPVKGMAGWLHPSIGTPTKQEITVNGKKQAGGVNLWPVGTWSLKSELYSNLRKAGIASGEEQFPAGFCFFSKQHDQQYFEQLTAEALKEITKNGKTRKEWDANGRPNHFHDCRIYNMAMVDYLIMTHRLDDEMWEKLRIEKERPPEHGQVDMFASPLAQKQDNKNQNTSAKTADADWIPDKGEWL